MFDKAFLQTTKHSDNTVTFDVVIEDDSKHIRIGCASKESAQYVQRMLKELAKHYVYATVYKAPDET